MLPAVLLVAILGCVFVVLLLITMVGGGDRAAFSGGSFTEIERAMQAKDLHICHTENVPDGQANQAVESRRYDVAFDCESGEIAQVVVDKFTSRDDRDTALRNFEVLVRPTGNGAAYSYKSFSIYVAGPSDDQTQDRINTILRKMGAK